MDKNSEVQINKEEIVLDTEEVCTDGSKFEDMNLKDNLLRGIFSYGFERPSLIQSKAVPVIMTGKDVVAQSQSGTGKTGAFVISTLNTIKEDINGCQGLIVVPTRELACQIHNVCKNIGQYLNVKTVVCVGGSNIQQSREELKEGCVVVVGTPGRIIDMIERGYLSTRLVRMFIMDEADEMLSNSFLNQVRTIIQSLPTSAQICLFSATIPPPVLDITTKFMDNPKRILVKQEQLTLEGIKQYFIDVGHDRWKFDTFCDLYSYISVSQSIIYVNRKSKADELKERLENKNFTVSVMHGRMTGSERSAIMRQFRNGETRILISTDLLSRGIDIQQVSVVINYDLPHMNNKESYIHRIGRSGRYGRKGVAINFVTRKDFFKIRELEKFYQTEIVEMPENIDQLIV